MSSEQKSTSSLGAGAGPGRRAMLVTGASAGLGAALAREYAQRGWNIIATARRADRLAALKAELEEVFEIEVLTISADLFEPDAVDTLIAAIRKAGWTVDGIVNNAGYGHPGRYLNSEWSDHFRFNHLMVGVPIELCHKLLPDMITRGFGRIMNVASLAGHMPGSDGHTLYAAVKAYLIKFSESLNAEMDGTGVHVSALCPGFTITEFHDVNGTRDGINALPDYMKMSAEDCAALGAEALERNRAVFISGRVNKSIAWLGRTLPPQTVRTLMSRNSNKFRKN